MAMLSSCAVLYLVLLLLAAIAILPGPTSVDGVVLTKFNPGGQYIMLTFENGPHVVHTPAILNSLKKHKYRATFFVHGQKVGDAFKAYHETIVNPPPLPPLPPLPSSSEGLAGTPPQADLYNILKRIASEGHEIGISSIDSRSYSEMTTEEIVNSLAIITSQLSNMTGLKPALIKHIRPPNGEVNIKKYTEISKLSGKDVVMQTLDSKDWEGTAFDAIVHKNIMPNCKPGDIVTLRDTLGNTAAATPLLLDELHKSMYELLTIAEVRSFPDDTPK